EGYVTADSIADLDTLIDEFKAALDTESSDYFDIDYGGSVRRYVATPQNLIITRPKGLNTAALSLEFICASPVGEDVDSLTFLASTAITSSSVLTDVVVDGSYTAEPYITMT